MSPNCFQLLEVVEAAIGSAIQEISSVELLSLREPLLSALASRVVRQGGGIDQVQVTQLAELATNKSVEDLFTLFKNCDPGRGRWHVAAIFRKVEQVWKLVELEDILDGNKEKGV